jgi:uncharacterized circularly permuted ATP-grasp superfamily protein
MSTVHPPQSGSFDEMLQGDAAPRAPYRSYHAWLSRVAEQELRAKRSEAELLFQRVGITFALNGEDDGAERLIPFDFVPRIIPAGEWETLERGLRQRVAALNAFLADIYGAQRILEAGLVPADLVLRNAQYQVAMHGLALPRSIHAHIAGIDLVRHADGHYYVLEDNLRVPSGVSYMLENRRMMMRLFPELFADHRVSPVEHYPNLLLRTLRDSSYVDDPNVVVLTPGRFNSAYFEHAFLARQMGVTLVEGQDLFVRGGFVHMRTTSGPRRVDVIYRRIDDAFLDPLAFRADSMLGVPGLLSVYRAGNVVLANAIGTGVADDKSMYPYVPEMVRFYLGEEPILRNVPTWCLRRPEDLAYVEEHLGELVVKEVHGAGGYGMLVGPAASGEEIAEFRGRIRRDPGNYIAQPTLSLSTCPTLVEEGIAPRHIDLRPFVLSGSTTRIVPGGLTRVALKRGSLVVNSSQGGGTKDTWVLAEDPRTEDGTC